MERKGQPDAFFRFRSPANSVDGQLVRLQPGDAGELWILGGFKVIDFTESSFIDEAMAAGEASGGSFTPQWMERLPFDKYELLMRRVKAHQDRIKNKAEEVEAE